MARPSSTCPPDATSGAARRSGWHPGAYIGRDFFEPRVQQFKQLPIACHVVSPVRTFGARVLYHQRNQATLQTPRTKRVDRRIDRLRERQAIPREQGDPAVVGALQLKIEDVEEFRSRLVKIERGDELPYRIRCRWKDETETGRPGPYAPEIDDGVAVHIRLFQQARLLTVREVIKKW